MIPIHWGNMILAFAAIAGLFGWVIYFGLSIFLTREEIPVSPR